MVAKLLEDHKFIPEKELLQLCERFRSLLSEESNVHSVQAPVTVVGDIHGQFHDMLEMQAREPGARYELPVPRGLRRPRVLFSRNRDFSSRLESPVPRPLPSSSVHSGTFSELFH
jgi:hypothetical protein